MTNTTNSSRTTVPGAWPVARVVETLALKNALSAMRGRPCPVAARVLERLAQTIDVSGMDTLDSSLLPHNEEQ